MASANANQKDAGWITFDRLAESLQNSIQVADRRVASQANGDTRFIVTDLTVSTSVEFNVDKQSNRPLVRLPGVEELQADGASFARVTFNLRPVPIVEEDRRSAQKLVQVDMLAEKLFATDYRERLRGIRELEKLDPDIAASVLEPLRLVAESDSSMQVRKAAERTLRGIAEKRGSKE